MKTPADLSPDDTDATIFDVMAASGLVQHRRAGAILERLDLHGAIYSRAQDRWLDVAEYAAEWRHRWRYRQAMGSEEEAMAVSDYERQVLGL